jgi:hypothetical protein
LLARLKTRSTSHVLIVQILDISELLFAILIIIGMLSKPG